MEATVDTSLSRQLDRLGQPNTFARQGGMRVAACMSSLNAWERSSRNDTMPIFAPNPGQAFAGTYELEQLIALGSTGPVYEARFLDTNQRCAIKIMCKELIRSRKMRDRFIREIRLAENIASEFVVTILDVGIESESQLPFVAMELLQGEDLGRRLDRLGHLSRTEAVRHLNQIASALEAAHQANLVHRDLEPAKIFLVTNENAIPRVKVLGFGVAKLIFEAGPVDRAAVTGAPMYMAPEQFRPGDEISSATDIYGLGMIAYSVLVGTPYWDEEVRQGGSIFCFAETAMNGALESARERAARRGVELPTAFDPWFSQMTSVFPEVRPSSALKAIQELGRILEVSAFQVAFPKVSESPYRGHHDHNGEPHTVVPPLPLARNPLFMALALAFAALSILLWFAVSTRLEPEESSTMRAVMRAHRAPIPMTAESSSLATPMETADARIEGPRRDVTSSPTPLSSSESVAQSPAIPLESRDGDKAKNTSRAPARKSPGVTSERRPTPRLWDWDRGGRPLPSTRSRTAAPNADAPPKRPPNSDSIYPDN